MAARTPLREPPTPVLAHPIADLFPLLEGADFDALAADIQQHGLRDPILVDGGGRILDGRNRLRACQVAYVAPRFERWDGDDPTTLIISRNLHRRHLSESQRGLIAAQLATRTHGGQRRGTSAPSTAEVAAHLGVGERTVKNARVVLKANPAVRQAVERGDLTVRVAAEELRAGRNPLQVHFSSETAEHYTPMEVLAAVVDCLGAIDLDPCSNSRTKPHVPAKHHFTREDDGLSRDWFGRVFMNPPYGREIDAWVAKLVGEVENGHVTAAIALVPARVDTGWFHRFRNYSWCAVQGRLTFVGNHDPAPFPSAVVYLDGDGDGLSAFFHRFKSSGDIWQRLNPEFNFAE